MCAQNLGVEGEEVHTRRMWLESGINCHVQDRYSGMNRGRGGERKSTQTHANGAVKLLLKTLKISVTFCRRFDGLTKNAGFVMTTVHLKVPQPS